MFFARVFFFSSTYVTKRANRTRKLRRYALAWSFNLIREPVDLFFESDMYFDLRATFLRNDVRHFSTIVAITVIKWTIKSTRIIYEKASSLKQDLFCSSDCILIGGCVDVTELRINKNKSVSAYKDFTSC